MNANANHQPAVSPTAPVRLSLVRLAAQSNGAASPAVTRIVAAGSVRRGPGRVAVAAFNSSV